MDLERSIWIVASDALLAASVSHTAALQSFQTVKGIVFVVLSAVLVGLLAYRELPRAVLSDGTRPDPALDRA